MSSSRNPFSFRFGSDPFRDDKFFGTPSAQDLGKQHVLDEDYFARIDAMEFALSFDDGNKTERLDKADVIVLGVSRTSKTPTCVYLSHRYLRGEYPLCSRHSDGC